MLCSPQMTTMMEGYKGYTPTKLEETGEPLIIFYDLSVRHNDDNVIQTVEYQERCDLFKPSKANVHICEIVASSHMGSTQRFYETFKNPSAENYRSVLSEFIRWMNGLKEYEDQKIILVAHNNQFFHFHILKWTYETFLSKPLPEDIYFFDSMTLVKKFQLIGWLI